MFALAPSPFDRPSSQRTSSSRPLASRSTPGRSDEGDEPDLAALEPESAWEFDRRLEIHDRIVAAKLELDVLDPDLVDVPLTILRGLIEDLEGELGGDRWEP